jgi:hypothetical protein
MHIARCAVRRRAARTKKLGVCWRLGGFSQRFSAKDHAIAELSQRDARVVSGHTQFATAGGSLNPEKGRKELSS